jgi:hypothetical protein
MNKPLTAMIGALAIALTSCSGGITTAAPIIGVSGSTGSVTITETKDRTTGEITRKVDNKAAVFTFRSTRGSPGGIITGYKITSMKIGSSTTDLVDPKKPLIARAFNVFVQSGFSCTPVPAPGQNCSKIDKDPANGAESAAISIGDANLEGFMLSNGGSANIVYTIIFTGVDDTGHDFEIPVPGFQFIGSYVPVK